MRVARDDEVVAGDDDGQYLPSSNDQTRRPLPGLYAYRWPWAPGAVLTSDTYTRGLITVGDASERCGRVCFQSRFFAASSAEGAV
jgi:hypothetical protein